MLQSLASGDVAKRYLVPLGLWWRDQGWLGVCKVRSRRRNAIDANELSPRGQPIDKLLCRVERGVDRRVTNDAINPDCGGVRLKLILGVVAGRDQFENRGLSDIGPLQGADWLIGVDRIAGRRSERRCLRT